MEVRVVSLDGMEVWVVSLDGQFGPPQKYIEKWKSMGQTKWSSLLRNASFLFTFFCGRFTIFTAARALVLPRPRPNLQRNFYATNTSEERPRIWPKRPSANSSRSRSSRRRIVIKNKISILSSYLRESYALRFLLPTVSNFSAQWLYRRVRDAILHNLAYIIAFTCFWNETSLKSLEGEWFPGFDKGYNWNVGIVN